ncbi:hypothetical protein QJS04_geneDACA004802 [Acorus gramineus]|uniref:Uncharacterized protein n=1 Tax=Acorus gramineus TaxID=55184 RepID=A0AAV9BZB3_ACOGR|nr:hypothetical protein QJS04_geneDACA004802 [Acorus gramineus]
MFKTEILITKCQKVGNDLEVFGCSTPNMLSIQLDRPIPLAEYWIMWDSEQMLLMKKKITQIPHW